MTRTIKPHKGGRTVNTHVRMTPEVQSLLKQLKLSAADILEEAVREKARYVIYDVAADTETVAFSTRDEAEAFCQQAEWTDHTRVLVIRERK